MQIELAEFLEIGSTREILDYAARSISPETLELFLITAEREVFSILHPIDAVMPSLQNPNSKIEFWEREIHQLFGVKFSEAESNRELFVSQSAASSAVSNLSSVLRSEKLLAKRNTVSWPGAKEPGVDNPVGKRRLLPPGVNPDASSEDFV